MFEWTVKKFENIKVNDLKLFMQKCYKYTLRSLCFDPFGCSFLILKTSTLSLLDCSFRVFAVVHNEFFWIGYFHPLVLSSFVFCTVHVLFFGTSNSKLDFPLFAFLTVQFDPRWLSTLVQDRPSLGLQDPTTIKTSYFMHNLYYINLAFQLRFTFPTSIVVFQLHLFFQVRSNLSNFCCTFKLRPQFSKLIQNFPTSRFFYCSFQLLVFSYCSFQLQGLILLAKK